MERETRINELMDELSCTPVDVLSDKDKRAICEKMLDRELESEEEARSDVRGMALSSLGCFIISLLTVIPFIVPVMLIPDFSDALLAASLLSSVILFFIGFYMAKYLGLNRWVTGITITVISLGIALIATFTGG